GARSTACPSCCPPPRENVAMIRPWPPLRIAFLVVALLVGCALAGYVCVSLGWPPPLVLEKPRVVLVPDSRVYRAPNLDFNLFMYDGKYYSLHDGQWFVAVKIGAPWTPIVFESAPIEVRAI